jgi:hypothetical protein
MKVCKRKHCTPLSCCGRAEHVEWKHASEDRPLTEKPLATSQWTALVKVEPRP